MMKTKGIIEKSGLNLVHLREQGTSLQELANLVFDETNTTISPASIRKYILDAQTEQAQEAQDDVLSDNYLGVKSKTLLNELSRFILERAHILAQEAVKDLTQPLPQAEINLLKIIRSLSNSSLDSFLNELDNSESIWD